MYMYIYSYVYICIYVYMYAFVNICRQRHIYKYIHLYVYIYVYIYTYTYTTALQTCLNVYASGVGAQLQHQCTLFRCFEAFNFELCSLNRCLMALQCVAVFCSVLQCVAVCCSVLRCVTASKRAVAVYCSYLF